MVRVVRRVVASLATLGWEACRQMSHRVVNPENSSLSTNSWEAVLEVVLVLEVELFAEEKEMEEVAGAALEMAVEVEVGGGV